MRLKFFFAKKIMFVAKSTELKTVKVKKKNYIKAADGHCRK